MKNLNYHKLVDITMMILFPRIWICKVTTTHPTTPVETQKKTFPLPLIRAIALLVSFLFSYLTAHPAFGQEPVGQVGNINNFKRFPKVKYDISSYNIEKLSIGQKLPEELWDLDLWLVYPDGHDEVVKLSQFANKKLIIFDFWATWCSPCIASIEEFIASGNISHEDIIFLPVHVDFDYKALPFITERKWDLPCLIGESAFRLQKYFYDQVAAGGVVWIVDGVFKSLSYDNTNNIVLIPNILQGDNVVLDSYSQHPLIITN